VGVGWGGTILGESKYEVVDIPVYRGNRGIDNI
jgi:hypothetical protein